MPIEIDLSGGGVVTPNFSNFWDGEHLDLITRGQSGALVLTLGVTEKGAETGQEYLYQFRGTPDNDDPEVQRWLIDPESMPSFVEGNTLFYNIWYYYPGFGRKQLKAKGSITRGLAIKPDIAALFNPPVNTTLPVITGGAQVGQALAVSQGGWNYAGTLSYSYQWTRNGTSIPGAIGRTYVLVDADVGNDVGCDVTVNDGLNLPVTVSAAPVPVTDVPAAAAAGALADRTYTQGTGDQTVDASADFTGAVGGAWSVSGAGATIDTSGVVTIPTNTPRNAATVTVTYTNPGGATSSAFSVTIEEAVVQPPSSNVGPQPTGLTPTDVVTNDAEWDAIFAEGATALDGRVIAVSGTNFSKRRIADIAVPNGLTITSVDKESTIPGLSFTGFVSRLNLNGLNFQATDWPCTSRGIIEFGGGTMDRFSMMNCKVRHGYGPNALEFDTLAEYPEYERVDNVLTASGTGTRMALAWKDTATEFVVTAPGWIEFFNRGSDPVYVAVGDANVEATTASDVCAPNGRLRISGLTPTVDTHVSVITDGASVECNARTEIGLASYLYNAFFSQGNHDFTNGVVIANNEICDVGSGIKSIAPWTGAGYVVNNLVHRIYMDTMAVAPKVGEGTLLSARNFFVQPFSRSGIAEDNDGDAGDPHGDFHQMYGVSVGTGTAPVEGVTSAGNTYIAGNVRAGATCQGLFWSDNNFDPSYRDLVSVGDISAGGSTNGIACGEDEYPVDGILVYGATIVNGNDLHNGPAKVRLIYGDYQAPAIHNVVTDNFLGNEVFGNLPLYDCVAISDLENPDGLFFDFPAAIGAADRVAVEQAYTTQGQYANAGAVAIRALGIIDYETDDYDAILDWSKVPSGVAWLNRKGMEASTLTYIPKVRVINPTPAQPVVPSGGAEWRSFDADGVTVVQGWTSASGTVEKGQWIEARFMTSDTPFTSHGASLTVNGFSVLPKYVTEDVLNNPFIIGTAAFTDPSTIPAQTSVLEYETKLAFHSETGGYVEVFGVTADVRIQFSVSGGKMHTRALTVEDSSGASVVSNQSIGSWDYALGTVINLNVKVDYTEREVVFLRDGDFMGSVPFIIEGNGEAPTSRPLTLISYAAAARLPADTEVDYAKVWLTTAGERSMHKEISIAAQGSIAGINADPWKGGGDVSAVISATPVTATSLWMGPPRTDGIRATVEVDDASSDLRLVASTASDFSVSPVYSDPLPIDPTYLYARGDVSGLSPDTEYHIGVERAGQISAYTGSFRTAPVSGDFAFMLSSCQDTYAGNNLHSLVRYAQSDCLFFLQMGDIHYENIDVNDRALFEGAFSTVFNSTKQNALWATMPMPHMWDDHDYGPNNSDASSPSRAAAIETYRSRVPSAPLALGGGSDAVYHYFDVGRIRFAMLDTRSERVANKLISDAQEAWLISLMENLPDGMVLGIMASVPWIASDNTDTWFGAAEQRTRIADAAVANIDGRVFIMAGDMHSMAFDNGTNSEGGIPVCQAAPMWRSNSVKGGPYTTGPITASDQQYGRIDVTEIDGGVNIRFQGYAVVAQGEQTLEIDQSFDLKPKVATTGPSGAIIQYQQSGENSLSESGSIQLASAPTAGNLLVLQLAIEKNTSAIYMPPGFTKIDEHLPGAEISGLLAYKISDGTETGALNFNWDTTEFNKWTAALVEVEGPFSAVPLVTKGADKDALGPDRNTVTLTAESAVTETPAFAIGFYMNDSGNNAYAGNYVADGGFSILPGQEGHRWPTPDGMGQPVIIGASKLITTSETPSTTVGHDADIDDSIGFMAVFR